MAKKVAVIGASGYIGGELLRHLLFHDGVEVVGATSRENAGKRLSDVHPNLLGSTELEFSDEPIEDISANTDLVFLSLPHGESMRMVPRIIGRTKIIDLSSDYRVGDIALFEKYHNKHSSPELARRFIYGLPEMSRDGIAGAQNLANPGCFATGALLALSPLAKENLLQGNVVVDGKTGSSGSGAEPSEGTHHPERDQDFRAYKVFTHQHYPEIVQGLRKFNKNDFNLTFVPHSAPMVRGIFTTAYAFLDRDISRAELAGIYEKHYGGEKFIRIVSQCKTAVVKGTNYCDVSLECSGNRVVVMTAIDNLVKGGAGTAIQNMNLMLGFPETESLLFPGTHP
jgi:N-acetyl-gamma-glutamyl-phosphate reductase